ncbi:aldo/keto reductase [Streptomyces sp. SID3915]|uniref:aldo/keto reductase n=1 Tax=Streptomyces sp. SID3915 TaxID=2690263 RepID=UPI00136AB619|nr:aldo/keto reductase [Streptomyces sp. SID3915]MYX77624.1 aldo/keto reductase [Streptomyces sp. SID3915]
MNVAPLGGRIEIAGKSVSTVGFGTMRLTGPGTWGDPDDRDRALAVLRQAVHTHGISHIDTADAYGPHTVEHLVKDALYPYPDELLIATKVGLARPAPNMWAPHGHPVYLRSCVEASLRRLKVERLDLCYLHRIDPEVPLADQLGTLAALRDEGKIGHIGISKVTPEAFEQARKEVPVAAVQNVLNIRNRYDPVMEMCRDAGIPYVPYRPLDAGAAAPNGNVSAALHWLLASGPHIAPIPGTSNLQHLDSIVQGVNGGGWT